MQLLELKYVVGIQRTKPFKRVQVPSLSILHSFTGEMRLEFISLWSLQATTKQLLVSPDSSGGASPVPSVPARGAMPGVGLQLSGQRAGLSKPSSYRLAGDVWPCPVQTFMKQDIVLLMFGNKW